MEASKPDKQNIIDFLMGAGEYDGLWWGDVARDKRPPFWWRSKLREHVEGLESELSRLRQRLLESETRAEVSENLRKELREENEELRKGNERFDTHLVRSLCKSSNSTAGCNYPHCSCFK